MTDLCELNGDSFITIGGVGFFSISPRKFSNRQQQY